MFFRPYGKAATIEGVVLITRGSADIKTNPTLAAGDAKLFRDGVLVGNPATLPDVNPDGDTAVKIALSASEMQGKQLSVRFTDQTALKEWEDVVVLIETTGHPAAQHDNLGGLVVADGGNSATQFKSDRTEAVTDFWKNQYVRWVTGALEGQTQKVTAYNSTTKIHTVDAFTGAPATGDAYLYITGLNP